MQFKRLNLLFGWLTFAIAAFVYLSTMEPTASFWDCGEFISCAYKLEVGHQPGAPLFMMLGRIFSLLAGGNTAHVALMINAMSALASAFTILFLFWTITYLAKKFFSETSNPVNNWAIIACGLIGSLAYTFSDTFWFSAVEGEVYATSSLFTAVVFWAILKWDSIADEPYADRWILLIAFLMGLSIGVHLLNLLTIPAIVMVYYFRKYSTSKKGIIYAILAAAGILGAILFGLIPWTVKLAAYTDLLFVNGFGLPIHSGAIFYIIALAALVFFGIRYTHNKNKVLLNKIILIFAFMIIGYSSYVAIIIRSSAATPINIAKPKDSFSLLNYLNREQYEERPLIYGANYNAPIVGTEERSTYIPFHDSYITSQLNARYKYDERFNMLFPRMSSSAPEHIEAYKNWANITGTPIEVTNPDGKTETIMKPTFMENMRFFFSYQLGHMYFRYFMWNFSGRQDEIQGFGGILHGNWISGIPFIDSMRLGPQDKVPASLTSNKGHNVYFMLPLVLGLLGLYFHFKMNKKDFTVVMLFFIFTGIAIAAYLNEVPITPRERDYAVGGSFYVFCIWIGFGILFLFNMLQKKLPAKFSLIIVFFICLVAVPGIMARENWDDHDRSNRYTARDIAYDYLNSCAPNAILFTTADNDTYPLWYAQEVEGIRRDVRIVLMPFLSSDVYVQQLLNKQYEAEKVPMTVNIDKYMKGELSYIPFYKRMNKRVDMKQAIGFVASDDSSAKVRLQDGTAINYLPTNLFSIPVDTSSVLKSGCISKNFANQIVSSIDLDFKQNYLLKNDLVLLDIIATNNWKRPIYFLSPREIKSIGLADYLQQDGFAYKLVPVKTAATDYFNIGITNTDVLDTLLMHTYKWGNMNNPNVLMDYNNIRTMSVVGVRSCFSRLAYNLITEGKKDEAIKVLDKCVELTPNYSIPFDYFVLPVISAYYNASAPEKAKKLSNDYKAILNDQLRYFNSLPMQYTNLVKNERDFNNYVVQELDRIGK